MEWSTKDLTKKVWFEVDLERQIGHLPDGDGEGGPPRAKVQGRERAHTSRALRLWSTRGREGVMGEKAGAGGGALFVESMCARPRSVGLLRGPRGGLDWHDKSSTCPACSSENGVRQRGGLGRKGKAARPLKCLTFPAPPMCS